MANLTNTFSSYLLKKAGQITQQETSRANACLLDYLAVTEAGAKKNQNRWKNTLALLPDGTAPLLGYDRTTDGKTPL